MDTINTLITVRKSNEQNNNIETFNGHLIVDDLLTNRIVLGKFLEKLNIHYEFAENGYDALKKLAKRNYELIWMDIKMPIIDGMECVRIMTHEIKYTGNICVVSGYGDDYTRMEFRKLSIKNFLEKPITFNNIRTMINTIKN